ncbi:MAG TPA: UvrD-helicase domain-containing protein, partial [Polyangia bacterium]|nr:UvrD-helicase domain-containing protein [Polyangia bacterium]
MSATFRLFDTVVSHPATVVEASAGTGKTYQLEHLIVDLIAEGRATIDQILVVTFTERATNELLSRVRVALETSASEARH